MDITKLMKREEFQRLMGYWLAKKVEATHKPTKHGRRYVKHHASGSGQWLKNSRVIAGKLEL